MMADISEVELWLCPARMSAGLAFAKVNCFPRLSKLLLLLFRSHMQRNGLGNAACLSARIGLFLWQWPDFCAEF